MDVEHMAPLSFSKEKLGPGVFRNLLCAEPGRGVMVNACLLVQTVIFVFGSSQASRVNWILAMIWNRQDRSRSLGQNLEKEVLMPSLTLFLSMVKPGFKAYHLLILHWAVGRTYGKCLHTSPDHHLCSQQLPALELLRLRFRWDRNEFLGKPPEKSKCWM